MVQLQHWIVQKSPKDQGGIAHLSKQPPLLTPSCQLICTLMNNSFNYFHNEYLVMSGGSKFVDLQGIA